MRSRFHEPETYSPQLRQKNSLRPALRSVHMRMVIAAMILLCVVLHMPVHAQTKPYGLTCELLSHPEKTVIDDGRPAFGWIDAFTGQGDYQTAYQVIVSSSVDDMRLNKGAVWNSGVRSSSNSSYVEYTGPPLRPNTKYYWRVRVWNSRHWPTPFSDYQQFVTGKLDGSYHVSKYPVEAGFVSPVKIIRKEDGHYFIDFGKASFGTIVLSTLPASGAGQVEVRLGEMLSDSSTINTHPPGTIRAFQGPLVPREFEGRHYLDLPPFKGPSWTKRQTYADVPHEVKNILPFRYCELIHYPGDLTAKDIQQMTISYPFNDSASLFRCSNDTLNRIWDLCKHTIKATTYCGVYVDGDRERTPYEADAYIDQLGHYCTDREYALARYSYEYFFERPTWPTEWRFHSIFMAWQDYMYTGNTRSLLRYYDRLKHDKLMMAPLDENGLVMNAGADTLRDIVDWPQGERDGYELKKVNVVTNAFYYVSLKMMASLANALGKSRDRDAFIARAKAIGSKIQELFFDRQKGLYRDALGSDHASLHGNMFPLAFGLVPDSCKSKITAFIKERKMACSVYAAQYLMEALYMAGEGDYALALLLNGSSRSWWNMIRSGSTMAMEAWDNQYKPNLDWNHAWGAVPANIIVRGLMGIQPLRPGFEEFQVKPQIGYLSNVQVTTPTMKGAISAGVNNDRNTGSYTLRLEVPGNTRARVLLPFKKGSRIYCNGLPCQARQENGNWTVQVGSGTYFMEVK